MLRLPRVSLSLVVSATFVACGTDSASAPPVPTNLIVGGQQTLIGIVGNMVTAPLAVRVIDKDGRGVPSVGVRWRVVAGSGTVIGVVESDQRKPTDYTGASQVGFRPTSSGESQVEASVQGLVGSPVVFSIHATQPSEVIVRFAPFFDCYGTPNNNDPSIFVGPSGKSDVRVIVGETVEFIYAPWLPPACTARVVSSVEPPGGDRIDSGIMGIGGSFKFVPRVPGTWTFSDVLNGGSGTLTAVVP